MTRVDAESAPNGPEAPNGGEGRADMQPVGGAGEAGKGASGEDEGTALARAAFVEEFSALWAASGAPPMEGRVLAYLMIAEGPHASTAELMSALGASAGSVSMATRHLVEVGFIQRHQLPGERVHRFRVEDDVWGSWLARERHYLDRQRAVIDRALSALGDGPAGPRRRLTNGRNYMEWLAGYHRKMLEDWEAYKREHAADEGGAR